MVREVTFFHFFFYLERRPRSEKSPAWRPASWVDGRNNEYHTNVVMHTHVKMPNTMRMRLEKRGPSITFFNPGLRGRPRKRGEAGLEAGPVVTKII